VTAARRRVEGLVALVTGAGGGIGAATVRRLHAEGARVIGSDVDVAAAEAALPVGERCRSVFHDVAAEQSWVDVLAQIERDHGGLDILVNNAGVYLIKPFTEITVEEWNRVMAVNVTGVFLGMKHAAPMMAGRPGASIVNISSVAGLIGAPEHLLYGASKGAVRTMTKDAALELAPEGTRVNSVHPGYVDTAMADYGAARAGVEKEALGGRYPLGRIGTPEDVADSILFLASPEASYITGVEHVIDGGGTAGIARQIPGATVPS
jgi:NAD(P)-dependent dehydrogenase (short-subunit alcohol dehydrogenase family)